MIGLRQFLGSRVGAFRLINTAKTISRLNTIDLRYYDGSCPNDGWLSTPTMPFLVIQHHYSRVMDERVTAQS